MPNFIQTGGLWLADQLIAAAGVPVEFQRGILTPKSLTAIPTRLDFERLGDLLEEIDGNVSAWIVRASDLGVASPERGDTITDLTLATIWELTPLENDRCFEYVDNRREMMRIYGIEIGEIGGV